MTGIVGASALLRYRSPKVLACTSRGREFGGLTPTGADRPTRKGDDRRLRRQPRKGDRKTCPLWPTFLAERWLDEPTLSAENIEKTADSRAQSSQRKSHSEAGREKIGDSGIGSGRAVSDVAAGFTILVDSREQTPWTFSVPTIVRGLPVGDYSVLGHELEASIERKSLSDFVGSITFGRARFWRELEKLALYRFKAVVIEGQISDVLSGRYHSKTPAWPVLASAMAITTDLGIPVIWGHSAPCAARMAEWMLRRFVAKRSEAA